MKSNAEYMRAWRARRDEMLASHGKVAITAELQIAVTDHETIKAYARHKGVPMGLVLTSLLSNFITNKAEQWRLELSEGQDHVS